MKNNSLLLEELKSGVFESQEMAFFSHQKLNPERWKTMIEEKEKRDKNKVEAKMVASTDSFKCRKCGSRETTYTSIQTRSCDEPQTNFVSCIPCGNNWKC